MIKIVSFSAVLLGIMMDLQGCGGGCPSLDALPGKKEDCTTTNIAKCTTEAAVAFKKDNKDVPTDAKKKKKYDCDAVDYELCCFKNCCDVNAKILEEWLFKNSGVSAAMAGGIAELADGATDLLGALSGGLGADLADAAGGAELAGLAAAMTGDSDSAAGLGALGGALGNLGDLSSAVTSSVSTDDVANLAAAATAATAASGSVLSDLATTTKKTVKEKMAEYKEDAKKLAEKDEDACEATYPC